MIDLGLFLYGLFKLMTKPFVQSVSFNLLESLIEKTKPANGYFF